MKIPSIIAIYFVVWWITLFVVLPFGIKNAEEAGEKSETGHDKGAPLIAGMAKKALINSFIAAAVTAGLVYAINAGLLGG